MNLATCFLYQCVLVQHLGCVPRIADEDFRIVLMLHHRQIASILHRNGIADVSIRMRQTTRARDKT